MLINIFYGLFLIVKLLFFNKCLSEAPMHLITSFRYQHNNVSSWHNTILVTCLGNHHLAGEWN